MRTVMIMAMIASTIASQAFGADCKKLSETFEHQSKYISLLSAEGSTDNSVYRAIYKEMQINNAILTRQLNVTIMIQNKCPIPDGPINISDYPLDAINCLTERIKGNSKAPECDFSNWKKAK